MGKPDIGRQWLVPMFAVLAMLGEWCPFRYEVLPDNPLLVATLVKGLADFALLYVAYWWIVPRWRWMILIPVWGLSIFFVINIWYFRSFGVLMPFKAPFMWGNYTATLISSVKGLWRWSDIVYVAMPLAYTLWLCVAGRRGGLGETLPMRAKVIATVATVLLYLACQAWAVASYKRAGRADGIDRPIAEILAEKYGAMIFVQRLIPYDTGLVHYFIIGFVNEFILTQSIENYTPQQIDEIVTFVDSRDDAYVKPDSAFMANRQKNLILIIVESLNAEVVNACAHGCEITPVLNRLIRQPSTVSALNVESQVGDGRSSDGQLLYNTGLMPLRRGVAAVAYGNNTYPSLAQALSGHYPQEFICDTPTFWNHSVTSRQYGYRDLATIYGQPSIDTAGYDAVVFDRALRTMHTMPQPFFAEITTLSMHIPFDGAGNYANPGVLGSESPSVRDRYNNATSYFDHCLGRFIDGLKQYGLYDNTVIAIVSDHSENVSELNGDAYDTNHNRIVFVAVNTGVSRTVSHRVGQCDIYPTLLDVMGVSASTSWRGVGLSILNPRAADDPDARWNSGATVSDLIIRGNAFATVLGHLMR